MLPTKFVHHQVIVIGISISGFKNARFQKTKKYKLLHNCDSKIFKIQ